ncbi:MAG TPA: transaldolase family protein [Bacillota bacterium]|nr:transaldolase family protein [Bacillota bacterium]
MEYLIDSADISAIERIFNYYPIAGVTTNPSIVAASGNDLKTVIKKIRGVIGDKMLHVQALSEKAADIVDEGHRIVSFTGGDIYIKIPVTEEGIKAIKILNSEGIKTTATAIFTPQQALIAACAGADYVAPYINRLDNISANGVEIAGDICKLLKNSGLKTKVLAASFSNVEQIHMAALLGVTTLTIPPALYEKLLYHPLTERAVTEFKKNGAPYYNI